MKIAKIFTLFSVVVLFALSGCVTSAPEKEKKAPKPTVKKAAQKKTAKKATVKAAQKKTVKKAATKAAQKKTVKKAAAKVAPYNLNLSIDRKNGIYKKGEKATLRVQFLKNGKVTAGQKLIYTIRGEKGSKSLISAAGGNTVTLQAVKPWTMVTFVALDAKGKALKYKVGKRMRTLAESIGFMTEPEKIRIAAPEPADFDTFWKNAKKELAKVPVKVLEKKPKSWGKRFDSIYRIYDVKVACAGGTPVSGYLTIPLKAKVKSLPVIVYYHGAGVRSSSPKFNPIAITFDVNAHGIINGQNVKYYQNLSRTTLKGYNRKGANDRNKFYFRNMYLRVQRALDYVKTLPEWNGKDLIVSGGSQGGGQALVAGGMDKDVTLLYAFVPALCDHCGILAGKGRESGWPRLIRKNNKGKVIVPAVAKTAPYFDAAYFARRIKAESYLTAGLVDTVCVPTSVYSAYNSIPAKKKEITTFPAKGHGGTYSPAFQKRLKETLSAAAKAARAKKK